MSTAPAAASSPVAPPPALRSGGAPSRLFIGLWPDEPVRAALHAHQQAWTWPRAARLVRRERLHMTLHFLGDVAPERRASLAAALRAVPVAPLTLRWRRCRVWAGGIAVLETEPDDALQALHARIGEVLAACGFALESRSFKPHVTLARRCAGAVPPPVLPEGAWTVGSFALIESVLAPPAHYALRASYPDMPHGPAAGRG